MVQKVGREHPGPPTVRWFLPTPTLIWTVACTSETASTMLSSKGGVPSPLGAVGGSEWSSEEPREHVPQALGSHEKESKKKKKRQIASYPQKNPGFGNDVQNKFNTVSSDWGGG